MIRSQTIIYQRIEVAPLQLRGILKLIDHKIIVETAHLFVDKGCVVTIDDSVDKALGIGDWKELLFATNSVEMEFEATYQSQ